MIKQIIAIAILAMSLQLWAQDGSTSSPYSFYGLGLQHFRGTVESKAMGGLSVYSDSLHLNIQNPAQLGKLRFVTFTVGGNHHNTNLTDSSSESVATNTTFDYLALAFPVSKKAGVSLGLMPFTAVGYNINDTTEDVTNIFEGTGGLNRVFLSGGFKLAKGLTAGGSLTYNFGNIRNETVRIQDEVEFGTQEINRSDLQGFIWEFGAQYEVPVSKNLEFRSSIKYVPSATIRVDNSRTVASVMAAAFGILTDIESTEVAVPNSETEFPSSFSFGAGLGGPNKWFLGIDYTTNSVNDFSNRSFDIENVLFENGSSLIIGGFYIPKYNSITSYWQRATYRAGLRFDNSGLVISGNEINEFGISFGIGLPARRNISNLNLNVELGRRGTTDAGLTEENFFNIGISLSLNDVWFLKSKFN